MYTRYIVPAIIGKAYIGLVLYHLSFLLSYTCTMYTSNLLCAYFFVVALSFSIYYLEYRRMVFHTSAEGIHCRVEMYCSFSFKIFSLPSFLQFIKTWIDETESVAPGDKYRHFLLSMLAIGHIHTCLCVGDSRLVNNWYMFWSLFQLENRG